MKNNSILSILLVSLLLACFFVISPGSGVLILLVYYILSRLYKNNSVKMKFILNLFLLGLIFRVFLLLLLNGILLHYGRIYHTPDFPGWVPTLINDAAFYTLRGYWMALDWKGFILPTKVLRVAYHQIYGWTGFTYVIAYFHSIFGFSPISSTLVNCIIGSLTGVLGYFITKVYFSERVARTAGILINFFPSLVFWSVFNTKDTSIIFLTVFIIWAFIKFNKTTQLKSKFFFIVLIIIGLLLQNTLRIKVMFLALVSLIISYIVIVFKPSYLVKIMGGFFCIILFLFSINTVSSRIEPQIRKTICKIIEIHQATANQKESSNYKILEEKHYIINSNFKSGRDPDWASYLYPIQNLTYSDYVKAFVKGWLHFMFEPFPWELNTKFKLLTLPQMIIWYILTPFALLGGLIIMRYRGREYFILFVYFVIITFGCALTMSNIGTAFRFRDMVTPIFLIWVSVGLTKILGGRLLEGNDE